MLFPTYCLSFDLFFYFLYITILFIYIEYNEWKKSLFPEKITKKNERHEHTGTDDEP